MAGLSVSGVGSGIDIGGLVDQLVAAERAPADSRFSRETSSAKLKLSALGTLASALSSLQGALSPLKSSSGLAGRTVSSGNQDVLTATATSSAMTGSYKVKVLNLASAHKLQSAALPSATGLGAGVLHIELGSKSFDVTVSSGQDKPEDIASAVASAAKAAGVKLDVGVVHGSSGDVLSFASGETGATNQIRITRSSGSTGLDALVYDPGTLTSLTEKTAAADAALEIDGVAVSSASNKIASALPGVVIDLKQAKPADEIDLVVATDNSSVSTQMTNLVTAYNTAVDAMNRITVYGGGTSSSGALIGDAMVRTLEGRMRSLFSSALGSAGGLGLTAATDGKLTLNTATFSESITTNTAATEEKIGDLAESLSELMDGYIGSEGVITQRTASINDRLKKISLQQSDLDARMELVRQRYTKQFTAMDSLVAQLNNTSDYLSQTLSTLTGSSS